MAVPGSNADSVRAYLTGAGSSGGAQADPQASVGGHRSGTIASGVRWLSGAGLGNIELERVCGSCPAGVGVLEGDGGSRMRWTAPGGGAAGDWVEMPDGVWRLLEDGASRDVYVVARRVGTEDVEGVRQVEVWESRVNVVAGAVVPDADRAAGVTQYRCVALRNVSAAGLAVLGLRAWLAPPAGQPVEPGDWAQGLPAAGDGEIVRTSGSFSGWAESGWLLVVSDSGTPLEVAYYEARSGSVLEVPEAGRGLAGTSAVEMTAGMRVLPWHGLTMAWDEPASQPAGAYRGWDGSDFAPAFAGAVWERPYSEAVASEAPDVGGGAGVLEPGEHVGIWLRWEIPAGAVATAEPPLKSVRWAYETVPAS